MAEERSNSWLEEEIRRMCSDDRLRTQRMVNLQASPSSKEVNAVQDWRRYLCLGQVFTGEILLRDAIFVNYDLFVIRKPTERIYQIFQRSAPSKGIRYRGISLQDLRT